MTKRQTKNQKIAASYASTKAKRLEQVCHVRELKIQTNKLSVAQAEALKMVFVEAKWLTNAALSWINKGKKLEDYPTSSPIVVHKNKDGKNVKSKFQYLGSQIKQSIIEGIASNLKTLSTRKTNGYKVGKLKFRSEVSAVVLKQFKITYDIKKNKVRIQGIRGWMRVGGTHQLDGFDIANARLLNTAQGYFLKVTCYRDKRKEPKPTKKEVGIDLGCETAVTLSDGRKFKAKIRESDRLKRLQARMSRQQRRSKGWWRTKRLLRIEHKKLVRRKDDRANKIVHEIRQYKEIYMQDELLRAWHSGRFGRSVQHSVLGRVKAKIKPYATNVLPASVPTTKTCYCCGRKRKMPLHRRVFKCRRCGNVEDRDVHSAKNMIYFSRNQIPVDSREVKRLDFGTSTGSRKTSSKSGE